MWIVLASKSPRREKLLSSLGLVFDVMPSDFDEDSVKETNPEKLVQTLALMKAKSVAERTKKKALFVGADTIVFFNGKIIGKPKDRDEARRFLSMFSGKEHLVYTGICVLNNSTGKSFSGFQVTKVKFRELSSSDIDRCLSFESTMTGAGAYVPETWPILFESIYGSYTNVMGLPMEKLIPILRENGIDV